MTLRFISGLAFPVFYHTVGMQLFMEFTCEILLGAIVILCFKFSSKIPALMELLHSLTMLALLIVITMLSDNDLEEEIRNSYAIIIIVIGASSLIVTLLLFIP